MEEKVVVCYAEDSEVRVNPMLAKGWKVRLMIAENVSISVSVSATEHSGRQSEESRIKGHIVFILEKFT